jgi:hypothetical protein
LEYRGRPSRAPRVLNPPRQSERCGIGSSLLAERRLGAVAGVRVKEKRVAR